MDATKAKGPADFARKLGLTAFQSDKTVSRWLKGENAPGYESTVELMLLAGWLNENRIRKALAAAEQAEQEAHDRLRRPPQPTPPPEEAGNE